MESPKCVVVVLSVRPSVRPSRLVRSSLSKTQVHSTHVCVQVRMDSLARARAVTTTSHLSNNFFYSHHTTRFLCPTKIRTRAFGSFDTSVHPLLTPSTTHPHGCASPVRLASCCCPRFDTILRCTRGTPQFWFVMNVNPPIPVRSFVWPSANQSIHHLCMW